jgi:ATP-dependent DNA ligase
MMAPRPPSGPLWLHEIKHDGFRIIARKDSSRTRLYDRLGNDLTQCFPLIAGAMARLPSCTIDGEAVAYDDSGVPSFDLLRRRQRGDRTFLHAFDLIELAGDDRRRDPLEQRKFDLSRLLADIRKGCCSTHGLMANTSTAQPYLNTYARLASKASCRSARIRAIVQGARRTGLSRRTRSRRQ